MHDSEDRPEEQPPDPGDGVTEEDAAWREIVANFGDRATLEDVDVASDADPEPERHRADPPAADAGPGDGVPEKGWFAAEPIDLDGPERYVPPPPPPVPRPATDRLAAWVCVLGMPVLAVLAVMAEQLSGFVIPGWLTVLMVVGFLGGFGYLIATMPKDPDDPWDDGARV